MRPIHLCNNHYLLNNKDPRKGTGASYTSSRFLELIADSSPHDAELLADCGAETESGTVLCNGIGQGHIVVVDIDEYILGPNYPVIRPCIFDTSACSKTNAAVVWTLKIRKLHTRCVREGSGSTVRRPTAESDPAGRVK
jgi:hypothetical protein